MTKNTKNSIKKILVITALLLLTGVGCTSKNKNNNQTTQPEPVMCTQDARECPDGSYVGRTGPNCEFAPCPQPTNPTRPVNNTNWKTIPIGGIVTFQIPSQCKADPSTGSTYIYCPMTADDTPPPEFVFSSDGTQVNMRRWENLSSPYWNDVVASLRIVTPLNRAIQINIDK